MHFMVFGNMTQTMPKLTIGIVIALTGDSTTYSYIVLTWRKYSALALKDAPILGEELIISTLFSLTHVNQ